GIVYQFISMTPRDFTPAFSSATITFHVPKTWIATNSINSTTVKLFRQDNNTWLALETNLIQDSADSYLYAAATTHFSVFAIAGAPEPAKEPETATKTNRTEPRICIQVNTPATNGTHCLEYKTPCDVPAGWRPLSSCELEEEAGKKEAERQEPEAAETENINIVLMAAIVIALIIAAFAARNKIIHSTNKLSCW
ncbi:MAG: PGF-pre-PGF domain-containing protein, partial [Candidatus Aenigmarchaeota archaeon]|nr:PGF-pre-PGF domain-containing protein [Candidatus Aenigmarchaeota archaeon]